MEFALRGLRQHRDIRKRRKGIRNKGILWEYNGDGRWPEHWDGKDKRRWKRWRRRQLKNDLMERIDDREGSGTGCNINQNPLED